MTVPFPNPADPVRGGGGPYAAHHGEEVVPLAVARAKEGDRSALQVLYIRYAGEVHRCVNSIVDDHHEAEDITQGVFLKLTRIIGSYEQRDIPFAAWLRRVARNAAVDSLRAKRPMPVHELRITEQSPDDLRSERVRDLRQALERLPYEQREVLILRHLAGLSPPEIAEMLGKTEPAIHGLHHRARTAFKDALRELEAMPVTKTQLTE
jgi:RNA polymerase sigma-70 factor (ECF subfamily)